MGAFDSPIQVQITLAGQSVPSAGFSVPLLAAAATFLERVKTYTTAAAVTADETAGTISASVAEALRNALAQTIRPTSVKLGRIEADVAQVVTVTYAGTTATAADTFTITINGTPYTFVATGGETPAAIATAVAALVAADPAVGAAPSGDDVVITASVPGTPFTYAASETGGGNVTSSVVVTTANRSIKTELDLVLADDADWYGLAIESRAVLQNTRAAEWTEVNARLFVAQASDADLLTSVTTDLASTLETGGYTRTAVLYLDDDTEFAALAWLATKLAADPDVKSTIWRYATLVGVTVNTLTDTEITNAWAKNVNLYALFFFNRGATQKGVKVDGNPIDLLITVDWLEARIRERVASILLDASARNSKVPYTDAGISVFAEAVRAVIAIGVEAEHFVAGTLNMTIPLRANIPSADITARVLNLEFEVEAAGAIEEVTINGFVVIDF